jgi:drug/metabolite transporter (DMT)-like permease
MLGVIAAVLGAVLLIQRRPIYNVRRYLPFMVVNGAAEYAAPLLITFVVSKHIDAGLLTLIFSTTPIFTVAIATLSRTEKLSVSSLMACLIGFLAFMALVIPQDALPSPEMLPWCLAAFGIPLSYATGSVYVSRNWPAEMDTIQVAFTGALFASLFLSPFWVGPVLEGTLFSASANSLLVFAFLVSSAIVEMGLYYYLLQNAGAVFTSFSSFIMIISGFVGGALLFGEQPTFWIWLSVALFALALAFIIRGHQKRHPL